MTDSRSPAAMHDAAVRAAARRPAPGRLFILYLRSRHAASAIGLLVALGAFLLADLHWKWSMAGGSAAQDLAPLSVTAGLASIIGVATHGPFGEPERSTGRWLPYLRLGGSALLTALAIGLVLAGAAGGVLVEGDAALLRDLLGSIGIGLITAAIVGGPFAWVGPIAYWLVTESALAYGMNAFYIWPTRPANDPAAAICAIGIAVAGMAAVAVRPGTSPQRPG